MSMVLEKDPSHDENEDYEPEMESEFDPTKFECEWWMKPHECMLTLLGRAKAAEGNTSQSAAATVLHIGDTKHFLLKAGNIGAEGFKSLRDCLADLRRNGRTILRNCNWYVDNPKSLLKFIADINEAVRLAESEIRTARDDNTIRGLEQESVKILLERIIAGKVDTNRQPVQ
ncbi:hypothetical protein B484DRAFT_405451, partial [Ochromonadaceae sp. CCMP2298]